MLHYVLKYLKMRSKEPFFDFLISNKAASKYTSTLDGYVKDAKRNMQWRMQYMTWERQRAYDFDAGKEAGIAEGQLKKAIEDAKSLLADGKYTAEEISTLLKIPVESFTSK